MVILRSPADRAGPGVLIAPPFAEEMNKSRRMCAAAAQALQLKGIATTIVDTYGTGDSEGEFANASVACWAEDLAIAARWSEAEGRPIRGLLGVRFGCILGTLAARDGLGGIKRTVFWHPVTDGKAFLRQFLRLRVAASLAAGAPESASELQATLNAGRCLEIAGYDLSPQMAKELELLRLDDIIGQHLGDIDWCRVVRSGSAENEEQEENSVILAKSRGLTVSSHAVEGEWFWSSTEITTVPELLNRTVDAFLDLLPEPERSRAVAPVFAGIGDH
jgi:exosortase A-associated hydrolase 2